MNDDENEDIESGLDVLKDTVSDIVDEDTESPLGQIMVDAAERPTMESRPFREMLMKELEDARKRLIAKPAAPSSPLDRLIERFNVPTGKSGDLFAARQLREQERAKADAERRRELMGILSRQEQLESQDVTERQRIEAARQRALAEANKPQRLQGIAQQIVDLRKIIDDPASYTQEQRDAASRQLKSIGERISSEDRSTLGQLIRAQEMANSEDPTQREIGRRYLANFGAKSPTLTPRELREDAQIKAAKEFLKTVTQEEKDKALGRPSNIRTPREDMIIKAIELSQMPTFESVLPSGTATAAPVSDDGFSATPIEE